jgi:hypothetical protein
MLAGSSGGLWDMRIRPKSAAMTHRFISGEQFAVAHNGAQ